MSYFFPFSSRGRLKETKTTCSFHSNHNSTHNVNSGPVFTVSTSSSRTRCSYYCPSIMSCKTTSFVQGCLYTTVAITATISLCTATYPVSLPSTQQSLDLVTNKWHRSQAKQVNFKLFFFYEQCFDFDIKLAHYYRKTSSPTFENVKFQNSIWKNSKNWEMCRNVLWRSCAKTTCAFW